MTTKTDRGMTPRETYAVACELHVAASHEELHAHVDLVDVKARPFRKAWLQAEALADRERAFADARSAQRLALHLAASARLLAEFQEPAVLTAASTNAVRADPRTVNQPFTDADRERIRRKRFRMVGGDD